MINRRLQINLTDAKPIWQQIEEGVKRLIAAGVLAPGALVTSVRDLAQELRVNPTIVAKAYQRLVDAGVLTMRRWEGTFVAEPPLSMSRQERHQLLREEAVRYADTIAQVGATSEEALNELAMALRTMMLRRGKMRIPVTMARLGRR